jgi:hypothetical protein
VPQDTLTTLYALAAGRAANLKGLKGAARRNAELLRSCAIHAERMRCAGMTEEQLLARLAEVR